MKSKFGNAKYSRDELIDIILSLGFSRDTVRGKGDHVLYSHALYKDLKVNIPARKDLGSNEMSDICSCIIIIMKILQLDTSVFKYKEGVVGKLRSTAKNAEKDICILFSTTVKNCLGVKTAEDIKNYIKLQQEKLALANASIKK